MPFSDKELQDLLDQVNPAIDQAQERVSKLRQIQQNLNNILAHDAKVPNATGGYDLVKVRPQDRETFKEMSPERRIQIFNDNKAEFEKLNV